MNTTLWYFLTGIVAAALLAAVLIFFIMPKSGANAPQGANATTTSTLAENGISVVAPEGSNVQMLPNAPSAATLNNAITVSASINAAQAQEVRTQIEKVTAQLKKDPSRLDIWISLGALRLVAEDYPGAEQAWRYVTDSGTSTIKYLAEGDLGDLYMSYLKEYPQAEASFKAAIMLNPAAIDYYRGLYTLYTQYGYKKGTSAAADILEQGLKANPNNTELIGLRAQFQAGK